MNVLESQVSDLNTLTDAPESIGGIDMAESHSTAELSPQTGDAKRKSDDGQGAAGQTRAKRNRYISIACNECKRRKIKCNGNTPCQRCGNLNLECAYQQNCCANGFRDSDEFKHMNNQITSLQEQVNILFSNLNSWRSSAEPLPGRPTERSMSISTHGGGVTLPAINPRFRGPTSSTFSLDVAKNTLNQMGIPSLPELMEESTMDSTPLGSPPLRPFVTTTAPSNLDPLWLLNEEEAVRLCSHYEREVGILYPLLNIEEVMAHARALYRIVWPTMRTGLASEQHLEIIRNTKTYLLKMVLATALTVETCGQSEIAKQLYDNVRPFGDSVMHTELVDIQKLPVLALMGMYHFHCDEEALAWRIIGYVSHLCVELGLHRRDALFKTLPDPAERADVLRMFWSIYVLDRRWSFGVGLPFVLQDSDIDPALPEPDLPIPYLNVMIRYARISGKVWSSLNSFDPSENVKKSDIGYLDYQAIQWQKSIPPELQLPRTNDPQSPRAMHRLQILLYLRANQIRILIYRPVLLSANSIMENLAYAQTVVELARDSIRALSHLAQTSDIYASHQSVFNYFLITALAVLFLASCHAPVQFSGLCKEEFYMALDLIKNFSAKSYVSKRLWRTIKGLKEVGPKLGLLQDSRHKRSTSTVEDPHSSAALAMAGLAGHEISGMRGFVQRMSDSPMNGELISHEMTNLFEAAMTNANGEGYNLGTGLEGVQNDENQISAMSNGANDALYRQFQDLF